MSGQHPPRIPNVTLGELDRLDWWLWSRLPLAELHDLSVEKKRTGGKSGPPQLDKNMEELLQPTWAYHEEWNRRRQEARRTGDVAELSKLYLLVQYSTVGICIRRAYKSNGTEVLLDYSENNGWPCQPERFRLRGEADPGDQWAAVDLPIAGRGGRPLREEAVYEVVLGDCIDQGLKLLVEGLNPVILNIADGQRPGGGYRQGSSGQEEDLFRRTDYCLSVDEELQQLMGQQPQWAKAPKVPLYPQGAFGAVYSRQLVFRHGEEHGYELMPKTEALPFIALAPPRRQSASFQDSLKPQEELEIFKKAALVCEVAIHKGHRAVVLGALGCGRARHPPEDVAMLFRAALSCFQGRFRKVVFAVQDEQQYESFARHFDEAGSALLARVPCMGLPPRVRRGPTSSCLLCPVAWAHIRAHRGSASGWQDEDCPWLRLGSQRATQFHRRCFWHPPLCDKAGQCGDSSAEHLREFVHPQPAASQGQAGKEGTDVSQAHIEAGGHSASSNKAQPPDRAQPPQCTHGPRCPQFLDRRHCSRWCHPFKPPCPSAHLCPVEPEKEPEHWRSFSHVCLEGEACRLLQARDPEHLSRYVHPDLSLLPNRTPCSAGQHCQEQSIAHRLRCAHPGELQQLLGGALQRGPSSRRSAHEALEVQEQSEVPRCPYRGINSGTDFVENSEFLRQHAEDAENNVPDKELREVAAWIGQLRPTHRCKIETLQSMLQLGALISTAVIDEIHQRGPEAVSRIAHEVSERCPVCRSEFQKAERQGQACRQQLQKYLQLVAVAEFLKKSGSAVGLGQPFRKAHLEELEAVKKALVSLGVEAGSLRAVSGVAERIGLACHGVKMKDVCGVGYSVDRHLNSHRSIFALLGPHTGQYYGHICLVLRRDLLFHVDSLVLPNAATALTSGEACIVRPWCPSNPEAPARGHACEDCHNMGFESCEFRDENAVVFHRSKLHPCVDQWQWILAREMLCQAKHLKYEVSLRGVQKMWSDRDSHAVLEVHLPSLIHFGCVETIVMTREQRTLLSEQDWELLREHFGGRIPLECRELPRNDSHIFKPAYKQTAEFVEEPHAEHGHMGLCIRLPPYNFESRRIFQLPLSMVPGTHYLMLQASCGATFCIVLAPSAAHLQDPRRESEKDFVIVTIAANTSPGHSSLLIGSGLPRRPDFLKTTEGEARRKPEGPCCVQNFDEGAFGVGGYHSFALQVTTSGQVLLGHYGVDTFLNHKIGVYSPASVPWAQRVYVGLLTLEKAVSFVNVVVSKTPPPAVVALEQMAKSELSPGHGSHLHAPWNDAYHQEGSAPRSVTSHLHAAPFRVASRSISAFMEMDMLQHVRQGPSRLARLATPLKAGLPSRRSSLTAEENVPQKDSSENPTPRPSSSSSASPSAAPEVLPDDPRSAQSSSSASALLVKSSDEGNSADRACSSTERWGQTGVGDDDPIPDIHTSAAPQRDWARSDPSHRSSSKLGVPGPEQNGGGAWRRQFTPPSSKRSSQPRVPDSEGKTCPQLPIPTTGSISPNREAAISTQSRQQSPPRQRESPSSEPLVRDTDDKAITQQSSPPGLPGAERDRGGNKASPRHSGSPVSEDRSTPGTWLRQGTASSGFQHASGLWPRLPTGSSNSFGLPPDDGLPPTPMATPPSPGPPAATSKAKAQADLASPASPGPRRHLSPAKAVGSSPTRSHSPARSPATRGTLGSPLTTQKIGSAELMGAPDPVEAELWIHKGSQPQVGMVAPDPQDSELEVHKPLSYVFHGHCQALKVTL